MLFFVKEYVSKALQCCVVGLLLALWSVNGLAEASVSVLMSLPEELAREARVHIFDAFDAGQYPVTVYSLPEFKANSNDSLLTDSVVLATGRESCQYASRNLQENHVLCVLVSADAFDEIRDNRRASIQSATGDLYRFGAIVIDQPLARQVTIASSVFPSLKNFGVLVSNWESNQRSSVESEFAGGRSTVTIDHFNKNRAVAPQVVNTLSGQDALVALPDKNVYSSERLRTVLLTAYGYAKPVIGYSRSYVKAGALITTFTTPEQIFRQSAEILDNFITDARPAQITVYDPRYFSIAYNPSIAKSLGLVRRFHFREGYDYIDKDFLL